MANHSQEAKDKRRNSLNMQKERQQGRCSSFEKVDRKSSRPRGLSQNSESIGRSGIATAVFSQVLFKENLPNPKPSRNRAQ